MMKKALHDGWVIEKMKRDEIDAVAELLTAAFKTNPAYSLIFKKEKLLEDGLRWVFKANLSILNYRQALTRVVKEKSEGGIIATYTIVPPTTKPSPFSYAGIGIPGFISKFGITPVCRMLSLDKLNNQVLEDAIKTFHYYYLHMVVVREEYRGRGIGSSVLQQAFHELATSAPTHPTLALTTQLPENIVFYSKLGFETLNKGYINFKGDRYFNCNMRMVIPFQQKS